MGEEERLKISAHRFHTDELRLIEGIISHLDFQERKALITLTRSGALPQLPLDQNLYNKVLPVLHIFQRPGYDDNKQYIYDHPLLPYISDPLTRGLIVSMILDIPFTDDEQTMIRSQLLSKEYEATQSRRKPSTWDWNLLFNNKPSPTSQVNPLFPRQSPLHSKFRAGITKMKRRLDRNRIILPYYSTRGISSDTARWIEVRRRQKWTFDGSTMDGPEFRNAFADRITSLDVVRYYVNNGVWPSGCAEMKQKWYPSGLVPRTYFSWGGHEIQYSTYLRDIFSEIADCFEPTDRLKRVQPDWLQKTSPEHHFLFYDLTSFTSWFHEHEPFLRAMAECFKGVEVLTSGYKGRVETMDIGESIELYCDNVNDFPSFSISRHLVEGVREGFEHMCAGFLGVPGNLVTCTLAHGLAQSYDLRQPNQLQVPGDDVGKECFDKASEFDTKVCANTLGVLQFDKVYSTEGGAASVYLKREVLPTPTSIRLADILIYPLFPFLDTNFKRDHRFNVRVDIVPRAVSILVTLIRDFWKHTKGNSSDFQQQTVFSVIREVHHRLALPEFGILQGQATGFYDEFDMTRNVPDVQLKFPMKIEFLQRDPDQLFADHYVEKFQVRYYEDDEIVQQFSNLRSGEVMTVYSKKGWNYLMDMGYVEKQSYTLGGSGMSFIGVEAKRMYLVHRKTPCYTVKILHDVPVEMLASVGIVTMDFGDDFREVVSDGFVKRVPLVSNWIFNPSRQYVDPDQPHVSWGELDYGEDAYTGSTSELVPISDGVDLDFLLSMIK